MGQKVNPHGLRVGVIKDWDSRWYARADQVGDLVVEDYNIRKYLKNRLYSAGIAKIEVERNNAKVKINIHCSRPGVVIGKAGAEIENLRKDMEARLGKSVNLNIVEVRSPDLNAQLVAENIAQQLEKRISFRRAMKKAMQQATRLGAKGIKVTCGGRLGGAEIARSESYHEGTIPLQTIRADIEYGFAEAATTFGRIGKRLEPSAACRPCKGQQDKHPLLGEWTKDHQSEVLLPSGGKPWFRFSIYASHVRYGNFSPVKRKSLSASHDMWQRRRAFVMESFCFNYSDIRSDLHGVP